MPVTVLEELETEMLCQQDLDVSEMESIRLLPEDMPRWDAFVQMHPHGSIFHTSLWCKVLERAFPHIRGHFLALLEPRTGAIVAGFPVYSVSSYLLGNRLVCVPFASFCDPLVGTHAEFDRLLSEVAKLQAKTRAKVCEFRPWYASLPLFGQNLQISQLYKHHTLSLTRPLEEIKKGTSRSCVRQWISRAEKHGVTIQIGSDRNHYRDFFNLLTETRRRLSLPPIPYRFFDAIRSVLPADWAICLTAMHGDRPLAGALAFRYRGLFSLEYAGDSTEGRAVGAGKMMYWEAIKQACESGCEIFSFGRTSESNESLGVYKKHWGATESDLPILVPAGSKLSLETARESTTLYRTVRWLAGRVPHPIYMWLGNFCYRHIG
jgi:CelD/BcsL family acetyltransferase involved in cellulose biosynthesis